MSHEMSYLILEKNGQVFSALQSLPGKVSFHFDCVEEIDDAKIALMRRPYDSFFIDAVLVPGPQQKKLGELKSCSPRTSLILVGNAPWARELEEERSPLLLGRIDSFPEKHTLVLMLRQFSRIREVTGELEQLKDHVQDYQYTDIETGLFNENYFQVRLPQEFARALRYIYPLSLITLSLQVSVSGSMPDAPVLKSAIQDFSVFLLGFARRNDVVIRRGEKRFLLMLPDTGKKGACEFAQRLFREIRSHSFGRADHPLKFLGSTGVAAFPEDGSRSPKNLLDLTDRALRRAKSAGGNIVYAFHGLDEMDVQNLSTAKRKQPS